jgi:trehalose 2-sulfotransferase
MKRSYLVCATPRSGSTLLCELLKDTGVAGRPEEYFEAKADTGVPAHPGDYLGDLPRTGAGIRDDSTPPRAPEHSSLLGLPDYGAHLERTLELGTGPGGVFGAKLMWRHLAELQTLASRYRPEYGELDRHELLAALFSDPRYVWVTRRDKVRQAISLWRALQTRNWRLQHADDDSEAELHYSFRGIDHLVRSLSADDAGWEEFFHADAIAVKHVFYEDDLERDRGATVRAVLEHIGVTPPPDWRPAEVMQRQADSLTEEWVAAYHRDATRDDAARDDAALAH